MLDNNFLFSIITPIRNGENFIKKYLESLLNQSYQNWEAIIIDDKSKDKGIKNIKDQAVVEVVTFSFPLFLIFNVKIPPIE